MDSARLWPRLGVRKGCNSQAPALFFLMVLKLAEASEYKETVVLLHGIAKTGSGMRSLDSALQNNGFETLNLSYPSTTKNLDDIAEYLRNNYLTEEFWQSSVKVHLVTHSMGGLVARRYLDTFKDYIPENALGRVVMLAPPNGGSEVADLIHRLKPYQWFYGPAGEELTTVVQSKNNSDVYYELGVIAGTKKWPYIVAAFVTPGKSDGRVTVEKTKLVGMKDHITVNGTHTFIMNKPEVHEQAVFFLRDGQFWRDN